MHHSDNRCIYSLDEHGLKIMQYKTRHSFDKGRDVTLTVMHLIFVSELVICSSQFLCLFNATNES